jgi:HAD superfamily hydrolase (TIGR01509 family)
MARPFAIARLRGWFGETFDYNKVRDKRVELMSAHIAAHGIEAKKGADTLLRWLKQNGYRVALATATAPQLAMGYLKRVGLLGFFDEICSARQVPHGKPAPDIYQFAANRVGVLPQECLALEDSPNGVRSAAAAGCKTVLVPDLDDPYEELKELLFAKAENLEAVIALLQTHADVQN